MTLVMEIVGLNTLEMAENMIVDLGMYEMAKNIIVVGEGIVVDVNK